MKKPTPVTKEQVLEWLDNPVTQAAKYTLQCRIEELDNGGGLNCYYQGEPQKTQEAMAELNGELIATQQFYTDLDQGPEEGVLDDE